MRFTAGLCALFCVVLSCQVATAQGPASAASSSPHVVVSTEKLQMTLEDKRLIAQGYTLKMSNGTKVFCRLETMAGTRFQHSVCSTASEIMQRRESAQEAFDPTRRMQMAGK
jgi:hypothetical protein